jgi:hypothetical protein
LSDGLIDGDLDDRVRNIAHAFGLRMAQWNVLSDDTALQANDTLITAPTAPRAPGMNQTIAANQTAPVGSPSTVWHVYDIIQRYQAAITNGYQPGLNWFTTPTPPPYPGFLSLNHELYPSMVLAAKQLIPIIKQAGYNFVSVAACDKTINSPVQNGDMYLPSSAPFAKLIMGMQLPLSSDTLNDPANTGSTETTTSSPSGSGSSSSSQTISIGPIKGTGPVIVFIVFIVLIVLGLSILGFCLYRYRLRKKAERKGVTDGSTGRGSDANNDKKNQQNAQPSGSNQWMV